MTLTELRYIVELSKSKHFGKAAKACNVSQPTLSVAIAKLEKALNTIIFERQNNQIQITEIGHRIIEQAMRTLEEADKITQLAHASKSQLDTPLKLGAIFTISPYLYPLLIPKLMKTAPNMQLLIEENFTHVLKKKLLEGELDAIFIALPFEGPGILTKLLYEEPFVFFMRKDHPLSNETAIDPKKLKKEEMLLLGEHHCFRDQVLKSCPNLQQNHNLQKTIEGTSLETLRHMVASGLGITVLPSSATQISHYKSIACTRPFKGKPPHRQVALAWRTSFPRPKAIEAVIKAIKASKLHNICLLPSE